MLSDRDFTRRLIQTVATVFAAAILVALLWAAREALMLVYISALIAMGFSPLVRVLERRRPNDGRRRVPRPLAILAVYLGLVTVFVVIGLIVIPPLVEQAGELWTELPREFDDLQRVLIRYRLMVRRVTLQEAVQNTPAGSAGNAVGTMLVALSGVVGGVFGGITILILSLYFLIEAEPLLHYLTRFVPVARRAHVATAGRQAVRKVSAWLGAQVVLAGVMGTFAAIGLGLLGEPYFYVLAVIAAIGETIPIVGPAIAGTVATAVALATSPGLAVEVGVYFLVLHQLEANVLVPKIMERRVGVSPVAIIIGLLIGGALWGVVGAILAIPTTAILSVIVDEFGAETDVAPERHHS